MKPCPHCAEPIQDEAKVCRFCNRDVVPPAPTVSTAPATRKNWMAIAAAGLIGVVLTLAGGAAAALGFVALFAAFVLMIAGGVIVRVGGAFMLALIVFGVLFRAPASTTSSPATSTSAGGGTIAPTRAARSAPDQLEILSKRGYETEYGGYHIVEGEVKNISGEKLERVQVVATWYTSDGTMVTSDSAMIEFNPLMPGQTSPFKTMSRTNPVMKKFSVSFKQMFGGTIPTSDRSK